MDPRRIESTHRQSRHCEPAPTHEPASEPSHCTQSPSTGSLCLRPSCAAAAVVILCSLFLKRLNDNQQQSNHCCRLVPNQPAQVEQKSNLSTNLNAAHCDTKISLELQELANPALCFASVLLLQFVVALLLKSKPQSLCGRLHYLHLRHLANFNTWSQRVSSHTTSPVESSHCNKQFLPLTGGCLLLCSNASSDTSECNIRTTIS